MYISCPQGQAEGWSNVASDFVHRQQPKQRLIISKRFYKQTAAVTKSSAAARSLSKRSILVCCIRESVNNGILCINI